MTIDKYIKSLRKEKGITQEELGKVAGVTKSTVNKWEVGKVANLKRETIKKLADYFGVPASSFFSDNNNSSEGIKIPVFASVAAGIPIEAIEDVIDYEEIDEQTARSGEFFGLRIKGNSMEPRICNGDVVIVRQQPSVDSGDIAIVMVNGLDAACKKIIIRKEGIELVSLNPSYSPMFYSNAQIEELPVKIIGKVVELRGKF